MELTGKTIGELTTSTGITQDSLFIIEQSGVTYNIPYSGITQESTPSNLYNLPVPNLKLEKGTISLQTLNTNNIGFPVTLSGIPKIMPDDLSQEQIDNGVWIEMLIYRKSAGKPPKRGFVVPPSYNWDGSIGTNPLQDELSTLYPGVKIKNRGGLTLFAGSPATPLQISRPNHRRITDLTTPIYVGDYLNGRFREDYVRYLNSAGTPTDLLLFVPVSRTRVNTGRANVGTRFCYTNKLTPVYVKFRYIMFEPNLTTNKGRFITGPLSPTVKIALENFPFVPTGVLEINNKFKVTCEPTDKDYKTLKTYIESNLP